MIIRSKAPLRLGLAGGGTDVSPYSDIYGGLVLNATINLYAYTIIEETDDSMITIHSYDSNCFEVCSSTNSFEINGNADLIKGVYNRIMKDYNLPLKSFIITTYNDAPAGSGLGTSSAMVVSLIKAFVEWFSLPLGDYEISHLSYEIERKDLGIAGGKQDQYASAFGGFNYMEFLKDDLVIVNPLKVKRWIVDELESRMLLYFTGKSRKSAQIIEEQQNNARANNLVSVEAMHNLKQSAIDMKYAILKGDMDSFGEILGKAWIAKKRMATSISSPIIDFAMQSAINAGAIAGKVSGAGGGGFIMFFMDPAKKQNVINALKHLDGFVMPFNFTEGGAHGWKIYD